MLTIVRGISAFNVTSRPDPIRTDDELLSKQFLRVALSLVLYKVTVKGSKSEHRLTSSYSEVP